MIKYDYTYVFYNIDEFVKDLSFEFTVTFDLCKYLNI
jgi:hypothetical protein